MKKAIVLMLASVFFSVSGFSEEKIRETSIRKPAASPEMINKIVAQGLMNIADQLASAHPDNVCETEAYPGTIFDYFQQARAKDNTLAPTKNLVDLLGTSLSYRVVMQNPYGIHTYLKDLPKGNPDIFNGVVFHGPGMGAYGKTRELHLLGNGMAIQKYLVISPEGESASWQELKGKWSFRPVAENNQKDYRLASPALVLTFPEKNNKQNTTTYRIIPSSNDNGGYILLRGNTLKKLIKQNNDLEKNFLPEYYTIDMSFCEA